LFYGPLRPSLSAPSIYRKLGDCITELGDIITLKPMQPITISTVGDLSERNVITAWCVECRRARQLDLAAIARQWGADLKLDDLKRRLRCLRCGGRAEIRIEADAEEIRFLSEQGRMEAALLRAVGGTANNVVAGAGFEPATFGL
jgi:hypothetical protein